MKHARLGRVSAFTLVALVLVVTGCATALKLEQLLSCREAHIGYWAAAASGNSVAKRQYATRIADTELKRRKKAMPGTLQDLRPYLDALNQPLQVSSAYSAQSPDLREVAPEELKRLNSYVASHKSEGRIKGADHSPGWAKEIADVKRTMTKVEGIVAGRLAEARTSLKKGNVAAALASWSEANKLDLGGREVAAVERQIRIAQAEAKLVTLTVRLNDGVLAEVEGLQLDSFGTAASSEAQVQRCVDLLAQATKKLTTLRSGLKLQSGELIKSDKLEKDLATLEKRIASLLGRCWGEDVFLKAGTKKFWEAYQYADARFREADALPKHRMTVLHDALSDSWRDVLASAVEHHVVQANDHDAQDAHGLALVWCRMGEEFMDFARARKVPPTEDALTWEGRCIESRRDAQGKLGALMQRRLFIGDFVPNSRENERLATIVYDECLDKLSPEQVAATPVAWSVTVEEKVDGVELAQSDLVINCNVSEFHVVADPPVELERSIIKVGREIREVPNPAYHPQTNKEVPKSMYEQEVFLYQALRMQHSRRAKLNMLVTAVENGETITLLNLDQEFSGDSPVLRNVRMTSVEERLDTPFPGPVRQSFKKPRVDSWPKATPPRLSSDVEIGAEIQKFASRAIVGKVIGVVASYPVDTLVDDAVQKQKLGNTYESANTWGQCLEYCYQLALQAAEEGKLTSWSAERDFMLKNISGHVPGSWKEANPELLRKMPDLWSEAVSSALQASNQ